MRAVNTGEPGNEARVSWTVRTLHSTKQHVEIKWDTQPALKPHSHTCT